MILPNKLPDDIDALKALITERDATIKRKEELIIHLEKLVADYKRALFGAKSEKGDPDQSQLTLEDLETEIAKTTAENEAMDTPEKTARETIKKPRKKRGAL